MDGDRLDDDRKRISQLEEQADLLTGQVESLSATMESLAAEVSSLRDVDRRVARLEQAVHRALDVFMPRVDALLALHDGRAAAAGAPPRPSGFPGPSEASCPCGRSDASGSFDASNFSRANDDSRTLGPPGPSGQPESFRPSYLLGSFYPNDLSVPSDSFSNPPLDASHEPTSSTCDLEGSAGMSTILADPSVRAVTSNTLGLTINVSADAEDLSTLGSTSAASCPSTPSDPSTPRDPSASSGPSTPSGSFTTSGSSTPTGASTPSGLSATSGSTSTSTSSHRPRSVPAYRLYDVEPSCAATSGAISCRSSSASRTAAAARASPAFWLDRPQSASRANEVAAATAKAGSVASHTAGASSTAPTAPVFPIESADVVSLWAHMPSPPPTRTEEASAGDDGVESMEADEDEAEESNEGGRTALHDAAEHGDVSALEALLAAGADSGARDHLGWSALHFAARAGHASCVKLLLQYGAEKDAKTNLEYTPLHWACFWSRTECVQVLLDAGASTSVKNIHGKTPLEITDSKEVQQLFRKRYRFFRFF